MNSAMANIKLDGDVSLAVKPGDTVTIFALGPAGPSIEGRAVVVETVCAEAHRYRVRLLGEKPTRTRFIHPDWQAEPERCLALLRLFWHAAASPPSFDDFFPDATE